MTKIGPETTRVSGSRQQYSADVNGSVMGIPVVHEIGNLGSSSSTSIDIIRTR
jgi:hypothetical protein